MRSRYSAYALGLTDYLLTTWDESTRPDGLDLAGTPKWLGLTVLNHFAVGNDSTVEFVARFKSGGRAGRLHEVSRFLRRGERWFYVDGELK